MTVALDQPAPARLATSARQSVITTAGFTALGAGAIHAAAIGVHAEHRPAALAFTVVAALQLCWGGLALVRANRIVVASGLVIGVGALVGWLFAKTAGISFVEGLDVSEPIQTADALAAGLALAGVVLLAVSFRVSDAARATDLPKPGLPAAAVAVAAISVFGMVTAGTHVHAHGTEAAAAVETAAEGHAHDHGAMPPAAAAGAGATVGGTTAPHHDDARHAGDHQDHVKAEPVPYDPKKPIDLSGMPGVTPEQQAEAENIIAVTLLRLPKWSDPAVAEAAGFYSIGDGVTGIEHFVNIEYMNDEVLLDPDRPESLVYATKGGSRRLVAAMYMTKPGVPLSDVPEIGGDLMQWHVHDNLCYQPNGRLGGLTDANGQCAPGLIKPVETPMIHVWIEPHRCGPFAALEGIGGGTIAEGEERLCDHAHGT